MISGDRRIWTLMTFLTCKFWKSQKLTFDSDLKLHPNVSDQNNFLDPSAFTL